MLAKKTKKILSWVVVSNIFYFHPYLGKITILTSIFFRWVVQPPTSFLLGWWIPTESQGRPFQIFHPYKIKDQEMVSQKVFRGAIFQPCFFVFNWSIGCYLNWWLVKLAHSPFTTIFYHQKNLPFASPRAWSKKFPQFVQVAFICFLSNFQGTPEEIDAQ